MELKTQIEFMNRAVNRDNSEMNRAILNSLVTLSHHYTSHSGYIVELSPEDFSEFQEFKKFKEFKKTMP